MSKQKSECAGCNKPIEVEGVIAIGKNWHKEHFKCGFCHDILDLQMFKEHDGMPYCKMDYDKHFLRNCAKCNTAITTGVIAIGKNWHPEHFQCGHCQKVLGMDQYLQREGTPYCKTDYHNLFSPKCGQCFTPVIGDTLTALGKKWHPECFVCAQCKNTFGKDVFTERNGKPYCENDFLILFPQNCGGCKTPIKEESIFDEGCRWHTKCLLTRLNYATITDTKNIHSASAPQKIIKSSPHHYDSTPTGAIFLADAGEEKIECNFCNKPVLKDAMKALGKYWHKEHFTCGHCNVEIGYEPFIGREGVPYCKTDFHKLFSPKCAKCNGPVIGGMTALGKHWHKEHFQCFHCGDELGTGKFFERNGTPYCEKDYDRLFCLMCGRCGEAISGKCVTACGKAWHQEHFTCTHCNKPFGETRFEEYDGNPYCKEDYLRFFGPKCPDCKLPVDEDFIEDKDKKWHKKCFGKKK